MNSRSPGGDSATSNRMAVCKNPGKLPSIGSSGRESGVGVIEGRVEHVNASQPVTPDATGDGSVVGVSALALEREARELRMLALASRWVIGVRLKQASMVPGIDA
jgi:hypothetical protein